MNDKTIEVMLDPIGLTRKPSSQAEIAAIRQRLRRTEVTHAELVEAIRNGHTWMPAVMEGGTRRENFRSQQVIALDFDNEGVILEPVDALQRAFDRDIEPLCLYFTFSATLDRPRYRMVWVLDNPICDPEKVRNTYSVWLQIFPEADRACKDVSRMFYGGGGEVWPFPTNASSS